MLPEGYQPAENEPFMNERHRLYFRNKLVAWKEEIIRQNRETLQVLHEDNAQHADLADRATSETDRALELRARDRQRKLIAKIDAALARIEEGTYGYCEETGEPIGLEAARCAPDRNPVAGSAGAARAPRESLPRRLSHLLSAVRQLHCVWRNWAKPYCADTRSPAKSGSATRPAAPSPWRPAAAA